MNSGCSTENKPNKTRLGEQSCGSLRVVFGEKHTWMSQGRFERLYELDALSGSSCFKLADRCSLGCLTIPERRPGCTFPMVVASSKSEPDDWPPALHAILDGRRGRCLPRPIAFSRGRNNPRTAWSTSTPPPDSRIRQIHDPWRFPDGSIRQNRASMMLAIFV